MLTQFCSWMISGSTWGENNIAHFSWRCYITLNPHLTTLLAKSLMYEQANMTFYDSTITKCPSNLSVHGCQCRVSPRVHACSWVWSAIRWTAGDICLAGGHYSGKERGQLFVTLLQNIFSALCRKSAFCHYWSALLWNFYAIWIPKSITNLKIAFIL